MNTTFAQQIEAIQRVRGLIKLNGMDDGPLDAALNDAGSTIAGYNYELNALKNEIRLLIHHAEQETISYSILEHARKLIFNTK